MVFEKPLKFKNHSIIPLPHTRLRAVLLWSALLTAISVMALATYATNRTVERFIVAEKLVEYESFDSDLADWEVNEAEIGGVAVVDEVISIEQYSATGSVGLSREIALEPGEEFLRLTGSVSGEDIVPGESNWEAARIIYLELDDSGKHDRRKRHELVSLNGTEPMQEFSADIALSETTKALKIAMQMHKTTGKMEVSALALHRTELSPEYKTSRLWLVGGWCLLLLWCVYLLFRAAPTAAGGAFVLVVGLVFVLGILSPGSVNSRVFAWMEETAGISSDHMEYVAHFVGFMLFGLLLKILQPRRLFLILVAVCALVSLVSEVLQLMTLDRSLQLIDLIINFSGAVLGVIIGYLVLRIGLGIRRWRYRRENERREAEEALDDEVAEYEFAEEIDAAYQENDFR